MAVSFTSAFKQVVEFFKDVSEQPTVTTQLDGAGRLSQIQHVYSDRTITYDFVWSDPVGVDDVSITRTVT